MWSAVHTPHPVAFLVVLAAAVMNKSRSGCPAPPARSTISPDRELEDFLSRHVTDLFHQHYTRLLLYAATLYREVNPPSSSRELARQAQDHLHDALAAAYERAFEMRNAEVLTPNYIAVAMRNDTMRWHKRGQRLRPLDHRPDVPDDAVPVDDQLDYKAFLDLAYLEIYKLSPFQQAAVIGTINGKTREEIAVEAGIASPVAVGTHLARAKVKLRETLWAAFDQLLREWYPNRVHDPELTPPNHE